MGVAAVRNFFACCKDCQDRHPACSGSCDRYAAGKTVKEKVDLARYESSRWRRRCIGGSYRNGPKKHR